jgi:capsular polysaccharide export protein
MPADIRAGDLAVVFGYSSLLRHAARLRRSAVRDVFFLEAGYLRSVLLDNSGSVYDQAICFFVDDLGFHFDATTPTRIEAMLNDPALKLGDRELERAGAFRRKLVDNRLTKYNDQSDRPALPPKQAKRVLVVEQSRRDWAVLKSGGSARSFSRMLEAALAENPDAEILVKVHPDSIDGKRGGTRKSYHGAMRDGGRVTIVREKINPYALLAEVDEVYVFSSMLGFEAAMMGKTVHVFGTPCYSGWGVTRDRGPSPRRSQHRTLDELVHAIYFSYQKYKNLDGDWCPAEEAADILLSLRERYFAQAAS